MAKEYPWGKGTLKWIRDATLNDSDKSFTVPAGKVWDVLNINYELIPSLTVGNRQMAIYLSSGGAVVWTSHVSATVAAATPCNGRFGQNIPADTTNLIGRMDTYGFASTVSIAGPLPKMLLPAGSVIRVSDYKAIDAAADDLVVTLEYVEYDA